jgi:hypothetical protein
MIVTGRGVSLTVEITVRKVVVPRVSDIATLSWQFYQPNRSIVLH